MPSRFPRSCISPGSTWPQRKVARLPPRPFLRIRSFPKSRSPEDRFWELKRGRSVPQYLLRRYLRDPRGLEMEFLEPQPEENEPSPSEEQSWKRCRVLRGSVPKLRGEHETLANNKRHTKKITSSDPVSYLAHPRSTQKEEDINPIVSRDNPS